MGRFFGASLRKSFADVTRRKGRTLLVVLGIFIGVFGLTAINTAEDALFASLSFSQSGQATQPDIILDVDHLDPTLLPALQSVAGVEAVQYQTVFNTQWHISQAPGHIPMQIVSYPDLHYVPLTPFQLTSGRYPNAGEIVLEYGDLGLQPFSIGDTVTVDTAQGTASLRVVGLARTPGHNPAASGNGEGYMSEAGLQQLTAGMGLSPEIAVTVQSHVDTVATVLQQVLLAHGIAVNGSAISTGGPTSPPTNAIAGVFSLLRILAIVAVVMSGFLILNTVTTLVAEQTAIIGTMKAAGGTRGAIMRGYLVSVGIYSGLATLPAIVLGLLGGYELASFLAASVPIDIGPFVLQWWIVIVGLAVGFGVPILAALLPLWNGTRISVRDALAAYGVSAGSGNDLMARLGRHLTWVSQTVWLGLRGVFRKRWRAAVTLLTLTLAGASFLVVQTASASVANAVSSVNANLAADIHVDTAQPLSLAQLSSQLSTVGNVRRVERYGPDNNVTTRWGRMVMLAFDPDTQLYHYHLTSGRWLVNGETDTAVLSDEALARAGLHIGDTLTISEQGNQGVQATLRIVGTVKQSISDFGAIGALVTSVAAYNQVRGDPAGSSGDASVTFLIQAQDRSPSAVNQLTYKLDGLLNQGQTQNCTQLCGGGRAAVTLLSNETKHKQQSWFVLYALLYAVALIVGAAGVLGLANALTASVLERRREIGMLRAMGASAWRVGQVFWSEGLALGGIAWLAGGVIGLPLADLFVRAFSQWVMPVDFVIDAAAFAVMLGAVVVIATLATIAPASRASQIRVADMLRYE
ncbi:MAG TPA: FtsX-like permease family protein [Ktedonobacterales bacterium]|nr:FtsX-like permease family protein [Ktedonobacterales bacterium]